MRYMLPLEAHRFVGATYYQLVLFDITDFIFVESI